MKKLFLNLIFLSFFVSGFAQERIAITHWPYLQNMKETEVTIVWVANKPSIGWVELVADDNTNFYYNEPRLFYNTTDGVKTTSLVHSVRVTGLTPGTKYRYRVYAQEILEHRGWEVIYGRVAVTNVNTLNFTTNDRNKPETSFIMINDIHGRADDIPPMLKAANYETADMVIFNGDMVTQMNGEDALFTGFMDVSIEMFAKNIPMYYARGNHETRGSFATFFHRYFSPGEPHLYYLVRQGPVCFIILDTGEDKRDSHFEYSGITDYENYRTEQAEWLKEAVKSKDYTEAKFKVVIAHLPPVYGRTMQFGQRDVLEKFVPILNDANVDIMLSAHLHRLLNQKPNDEIKFPVLANGNRTVLKGIANNNQLELVIKDLDGKVVVQMMLNVK